MIRTTLFFLLVTSILSADVKSLSDKIRFYINSDGIAEMTLNQVGLNIGHLNSNANLMVEGNAMISDRLSIGTAYSGSSNLYLSGSLGVSFESINSNANILDHSYILVDSSNSNIIVNLPYAGNAIGRSYHIKKRSALNYVTIRGGGNLIDQHDTLLLGPSTSLLMVEVISDGTQWYKTSGSSDLTETISSNLVAWWKLDEESGTNVNDATGNGYHGTLTSLDFATDSAMGKQLNALQFSDTSDEVVISPVVDLAGWPELTISAWVNYDASGSDDHSIFSCWRATSDEAQALLRIRPSDGVLQGYVRREDSTQLSGVFNDLTLSANTWHHVVMTFDQTNGVMAYLDAQVSTTVVPTTNTLDTSSTVSMKLGVSPHNTNDRLSGFLDDVRIYDRALSSQEIEVIYSENKLR